MSATEAPVHVHRDPPNEVGSRDRMGVLLLIVADVAFVASLIFTYLYLRFLNVDGLWLPEELTPAPSGPTWVINVVLFVGAIIFAFGVRGMAGGKRPVLVACSALALIAAVAALVLQWSQITNFDFLLQENGRYLSAYSSCMVALAGANFFHIAIAVFVTLGITIRAIRGKYDLPDSWQPRIASYWWVWVVVSAILVGLMTTFAVSTPFPPSMPVVGS